MKLCASPTALARSGWLATIPLSRTTTPGAFGGGAGTGASSSSGRRMPAASSCSRGGRSTMRTSRCRRSRRHVAGVARSRRSTTTSWFRVSIVSAPAASHHAPKLASIEARSFRFSRGQSSTSTMAQSDEGKPSTLSAGPVRSSGPQDATPVTASRTSVRVGLPPRLSRSSRLRKSARP